MRRLCLVAAFAHAGKFGRPDSPGGSPTTAFWLVILAVCMPGAGRSKTPKSGSSSMLSHNMIVADRPFWDSGSSQKESLRTAGADIRPKHYPVIP
jgi:hypothetical protein